MDPQTRHQGGCLCGAVRYRVSGDAVWSALCYCESCTRGSGGPAICWTGFEKARFRLLGGTLAIYESSPGIRRGFCARCGTSLTYQKDPDVLQGAQDDIYVATRTLDDPGAYPPEEHVLYGERVSWFSVDDELPRHDRLSARHAHRQLGTMTVRAKERR